MEAFLLRELKRREAEGLRRRLRVVERRSGPWVWVGGHRALNLASNDYLGLAQHPAVLSGVRAGLARDGWGGGSARLLAGHYRAHHRLERELAAWKGTPAALLFPTGYMANLGVVTSLAGPGDLIVSDAWNHASLIDACRLTRARVAVVPHGDVGAVRRALARRGRGRALVVTESVFSMEGDVAPLPALSEAARAAGAVLMVDEAHALGVFGARGEGLAPRGPHVVAEGTLSKAFGGMGGVAFGSRALADWLVNRARPFIYTTAPPPALARGASAALTLVRRPARRLRLWRHVRWLQEALRRQGWDLRGSASPIVPLVVGEARAALALAARLRAHGVFAPAVRPPTVPEGAARVRLSVTALTDPALLARVVAAVGRP